MWITKLQHISVTEQIELHSFTFTAVCDSEPLGVPRVHLVAKQAKQYAPLSHSHWLRHMEFDILTSLITKLTV